MSVREPLVITSTSNPRLKAAAALRDRHERERTNLILVEGVREVERALEAGLRPREVWLMGAPTEVARRCERLGATLISTSTHVFEKLGLREGEGAIISIFERPVATLDALFADERPLILAVHGVEKPGNLGALLRTADGVGVAGVVVLESSVDVYAPQTIRASLGTVFTQPVVVMDSDGWARACAERGVTVVAAALDARGMAPWAIDMRRPVCLLLGSEAHGLPADWIARAEVATVPMRGHADSLNVSAAGAMLLYEALRQRAAG